ncbi:nucleoplasmin-like [Mixophyes fleayi]|uniref:nucleoplasmin-like n=1 Tax=Mixophyes fleayi TaxID=3061075 RepID=UPI003F4E3314
MSSDRYQSFSLSSIRSETAREVCEIWGCELSASCKTYAFEFEEDYLVHLLGLWTICLGAAKEDETQVIAVETKQTEGEPVTVATLQSSILPMVNVHGLEFNPPVTFILTSGSGPVYISGQHITLDEDLNTSLEKGVNIRLMDYTTEYC